MGFTIQLRGEKNPEFIKEVSGIPGKGGRFIPLNFPCLSVHVTGDHDSYPDTYLCVTWSNAKPNGRESDPGKFKIQRIENRPITIYVMNGNRPAMYRGRKQVDEIAMRKLGTKIPKERVAVWDKPPEAETIKGAFEMLRKKFGDTTSSEIMDLFLSHPLLNLYLPMKAAA